MTALTPRVGGYAPRDTAYGAGLETFRAAVVQGTDGAVDMPVTWNIPEPGGSLPVDDVDWLTGPPRRSRFIPNGRGQGFEVFGYWDNGVRHLMNRLRTVRSPEDCAGMTVRMQPNLYHEDMIRAWGAIPVAVELKTAIGMIVSGKVDAQENPRANTVAYGVDNVHHYVTMSGPL